MRIICWQTIHMKYHTLFYFRIKKMSQNLLSAAVVIGTLTVNFEKRQQQKPEKLPSKQRQSDFCCLLIFSRLTFSKIHFRNTIPSECQTV